MNLDDGQSGTIMFKLHHDGDDPIEYTTSTGAPGLGLMGGQLKAGATYSVLLSDILDAVRMPIPFAGYVKITTDFTGADGIVYITNWDGFTATVPMKGRRRRNRRSKRIRNPIGTIHAGEEPMLLPRFYLVCTRLFRGVYASSVGTRPCFSLRA